MAVSKCGNVKSGAVGVRARSKPKSAGVAHGIQHAVLPDAFAANLSPVSPANGGLALDPNLAPGLQQAGNIVHHPQHQQHGGASSAAALLRNPRPSSGANQQHRPGAPQQPPPARFLGSYSAAQVAPGGIALHQHPSYIQPDHASDGRSDRDQAVGYYSAHPSPYGTPGPGQYSSPDGPDLMATTMMQRPYPSIYNTPQSNSPASVASSQNHDAHGRAMYGQPQPQLAHGVYGGYQYPAISQVHPPTYAQHQGQQQPAHPSMSSQPLLMSHQQTTPTMQQHQPSHPHPQAQTPSVTASPRPKLEPSALPLQRPMDQAALQRPPSVALNVNVAVPPGPPSASNGMHNSPPSGGSVNSNAAPGPIPATTPLVVRQDSNGVQWIAFEYSRDRVKLEYIIRCDVESVNTDSLELNFKTDNCVYPRACCSKDQYRGNRFHYETECNNVGWALAELNQSLRGKRGLIQRAVDSWRNSNQDQKLRSRRVRRMAKLNTRKQPLPPSHLPAPGSAGGGILGTNPMAASALQRQPQPNMGMGPSHLHHHHNNHPDGSAGGVADDVSGLATDIRPAQVFHGMHNYPIQAPLMCAMPPHIHDVMELGGHRPSNSNAVAATTTAAATTCASSKRKKSEDEEHDTALYGDLPENKRRKFILVDDQARGARVRVRVTLDQVEMKEIPDSYRKSNSVFPRSYFPMQMQDAPSSRRAGRFFEDDDAQGGGLDDDKTTRGRTLVPIPNMEGETSDCAVPKLTRSKKRREVMVNELGYRMSWSQSRVFAGRIMFLQKSLDAYRNKMRSTILASSQASGHETSATPTSVAPHFETRIGKRRWLARKKTKKEESSP